MKEYIISNEALHSFFSHAFYTLSRKKNPPALVYQCFDGERKQDRLLCRKNRDTERLPGWHSSKDFAYLARGMATIIEVHK